MPVDPRALGDPEQLQQLGIDMDTAIPCDTEESRGARIDSRPVLELHVVREEVVAASYQRGEGPTDLVRRLALRHENAAVAAHEDWADVVWTARDPDRLRFYACRAGTIAYVEMQDADASADKTRELLRLLLTRFDRLT